MKLKKVIKSEWFWLLLIVLLGAFLRFWKLAVWQYLTYDQSRDYIIVKRMLVDHKFTLVGPTVSIAPGFFLSPFYYYSLAPFLKLFNFHIVGPDVYTALFGVVSIILFFFLAKDFLGKPAALITTLAFALNPYLIHTSRHAWNPNTLIFFILLFALAFERYVIKKERKYFLLAGFSLGWSIGLHLTAMVFCPLFFYLLYKELFKNKIGLITLAGGLLFLVTFFPLFLFDIRHGFPISKAGLSYVQKQKTAKSSDFAERLKQMALDSYKTPSILLAGSYQKENLTVRPSNITSFSMVKLFSTTQAVERLKISVALFVWLFSLVMILFNQGIKQRILLLFLCFGLLIRLCFPSNLYYFYYYLAVFPFIYLVCGYAIDKSKKINPIVSKMLMTVMVLLAVAGLWPRGIYVEPKPENYFLPTCNIIAKDYYNNNNKVAIASNVGDASRWEHNGLEYSYFLESMFKLPPGYWEASDYKAADVLYFIDEGEVPDPLKFGGMEVEAFKPTKIEQAWRVETGQKIYKMTH